jgi:hypothetical protein
VAIVAASGAATAAIKNKNKNMKEKEKTAVIKTAVIKTAVIKKCQSVPIERAIAKVPNIVLAAPEPAIVIEHAEHAKASASPNLVPPVIVIEHANASVAPNLGAPPTDSTIIEHANANATAIVIDDEDVDIVNVENANRAAMNVDSRSGSAAPLQKVCVKIQSAFLFKQTFHSYFPKTTTS